MTDIAIIQTYTIMASTTIICISAIGTSLSFAYLGSKFLESLARQPEMAPMLTTRLFIIAGLLDGIPMMGVGVALWFASANPFLAPLTQAMV